MLSTRAWLSNSHLQPIPVYWALPYCPQISRWSHLDVPCVPPIVYNPQINFHPHVRFYTNLSLTLWMNPFNPSGNASKTPQSTPLGLFCWLAVCHQIPQAFCQNPILHLCSLLQILCCHLDNLVILSSAGTPPAVSPFPQNPFFPR